MTDRIVKALAQVSGVDQKDINIEIPEREEFGDYSTNIAMLQAKANKTSPRELAESYIQKLLDNDSLMSIVSSIKMAGPGFINFYLKDEQLLSELPEIKRKGSEYGKSKLFEGKKMVFEYTDPNPFKEFHIGHLMPNVIGECLSRLAEANGAQIHRVNYQGDIGMHVAKAVWGMNKKLQDEKVSLQALEQEDLKRRIAFLGEAYALGSSTFDDDEEVAEEIKLLNKKIFDKDPLVYGLYQKGRAWSLEAFEKIYARLGTKFNNYYFESEVGPIGKKLVEDHIEDGVFVKSKGAVIFPGSKYGLHDRVFINSLGLPTYEAKELGLAPTKYKDFAYDESFIITGNEIDEYFKVLIAAMKLVLPELGSKTHHLSHGMMRLTSGKISSRKGNVLKAEDLLDEVKQRVEVIVNKSESLKDSTKAQSDEISEIIAIAAVKYSILKVSLGKDIIFDVEKSLSLEGDSGPYIQYTYARSKSVIDKASEESRQVSNTNTTLYPEERSILRSLSQYQGVIINAAKNYSPNVLSNYLFELAQKYNAFYNKHKIIGSDKEEFRLLLTESCGIVLKNGLEILGIKAPDKM